MWLDDSMAIMMAFQTPELEILGLTTVFGNVSTQDATRNALLLVCTNHSLKFSFAKFCWDVYVISWYVQCEVAGFPDVPVAEGSSEPLKVTIFTSQNHFFVTL